MSLLASSADFQDALLKIGFNTRNLSSFALRTAVFEPNVRNAGATEQGGCLKAEAGVNLILPDLKPNKNVLVLDLGGSYGKAGFAVTDGQGEISYGQTYRVKNAQLLEPVEGLSDPLEIALYNLIKNALAQAPAGQRIDALSIVWSNAIQVQVTPTGISANVCNVEQSYAKGEPYVLHLTEGYDLNQAVRNVTRKLGIDTEISLIINDTPAVYAATQGMKANRDGKMIAAGVLSTGGNTAIRFPDGLFATEQGNTSVIPMKDLPECLQEYVRTSEKLQRTDGLPIEFMICGCGMSEVFSLLLKELGKKGVSSFPSLQEALDASQVTLTNEFLSFISEAESYSEALMNGNFAEEMKFLTKEDLFEDLRAFARYYLNYAGDLAGAFLYSTMQADLDYTRTNDCVIALDSAIARTNNIYRDAMMKKFQFLAKTADEVVLLHPDASGFTVAMQGAAKYAHAFL